MFAVFLGGCLELDHPSGVCCLLGERTGLDYLLWVCCLLGGRPMLDCSLWVQCMVVQHPGSDHLLWVCACMVEIRDLIVCRGFTVRLTAIWGGVVCVSLPFLLLDVWG